MPVYHVKCVESVNFTVKIEAESEDEARELAVEDINSHEVVSESTTDWDIEEVILESEEWYNKWELMMTNSMNYIKRYMR